MKTCRTKADMLAMFRDTDTALRRLGASFPRVMKSGLGMRSRDLPKQTWGGKFRSQSAWRVFSVLAAPMDRSHELPF